MLPVGVDIDDVSAGGTDGRKWVQSFAKNDAYDLRKVAFS